MWKCFVTPEEYNSSAKILYASPCCSLDRREKPVNPQYSSTVVYDQLEALAMAVADRLEGIAWTTNEQTAARRGGSKA